MYQKSAIPAKFKKLFHKVIPTCYTKVVLDGHLNTGRIYMPYAYIQKFTLIASLLYAPTSFGLYQPTALLLANAEENSWKNDSYSLDPIISELAINIQQQYAPLIVSRQLVHRLIRYQEQNKADQLDPSTKMHELFTHLKKRQLSHGGDVWGDMGISYTLHKAHQEATTNALSPEMGQFLSQQPQIINYFFAARVPLHLWQVYQVKNRKTNSLEPFYALVPPLMPTSNTKNPKRSLISLKLVAFFELHKQAMDESRNTQRADYCTISGELVASMLRALRRKITTQEPPRKLVLSLSGHGCYTRSQFGKAADRIQPKNFESLPTQDQCEREAKEDLGGSIAGLHIPELTSLLTHLDKDNSIAFFYYDTCYSGNQHLVLPYTKKDGTPLEFKYPIVSRCVDSGCSYLSHSVLGATPDGKLRLTCPIDPKAFFEKTSGWCSLSKEERKASSLKPAFLAMIGDTANNNVSMRDSKTTEFIPLLAKNHRRITHESACNPEQLIFKKKQHHLFLDHNAIAGTIVAKAPLIRSSILTNCTHYLASLECTDPKDRAPLDFMSHIFFHDYNKGAVNRMIFFIRTLKLITQGKPHMFHDVMIMHHAIWQNNKNSFAVWRNPKKTILKKSTYTIGFARPSNKNLENVRDFTPLEAHTTLLYYLKLKAEEMSYIEAPALPIAAPHAFDDTVIKEFCEKMYGQKKCNLKTTRKIWKLLGW